VYRPESDFRQHWFDATVRGRSAPCRPGAGPATLAVTQYHVRDGATVGLMSTPWTVAARGSTAFSRAGRIEPDVAALCVSTGTTRVADAVVARHVACVRPQRSGTDPLVTRFTPVATTDPLVSAALTSHPADGTVPTGPVCAAGCLVTPFVPAAQSPQITKDTPIDGPVTTLKPYQSACHTVSVTDAFAGPTDWQVNGFDVWMTVAIDPCESVDVLPSLHAVRYWPDRGVVMPYLDPAVLEKGSQVHEKTGAICLTAGFRQSGERLYGVHDRCWRVVRDQPDRYRLAPIATDDPRVRKPLVSNIPVPHPEYPPGHCASCL
jgi:hypothetical protein